MKAKLAGQQNVRGQSLVETALMLPLLLLLVMNVVNFGYFFLVMVNLTGAARTATLYSIVGPSTPAETALPKPGPVNGTTTDLSVAYVAQQDMTGALSLPTNACVQICTQSLGLSGTGANQITSCGQYSGTGSTCSGVTAVTPSADPEAPSFLLNEVDITYTFNTLIPGKIFNIPLRASGLCNSGGSCTFVRRARMRAMN